MTSESSFHMTDESSFLMKSVCLTTDLCNVKSIKRETEIKPSMTTFLNHSYRELRHSKQLKDVSDYEWSAISLTVGGSPVIGSCG